MTHRIVFIDSNVAEYQSLVSQLPTDAERIVLDAGQDGVMQILAVLQDRVGLDSIDIISHGKPGTLMLGATRLNSANLECPDIRYPRSLCHLVRKAGCNTWHVARF